MRNQRTHKISNVFRALMLAGAVVLTCLIAGDASAQTQQTLFASPEDAVKALTTAVKAKDQAALTSMFGPRIRDFLSGDGIADKNNFDDFANNLGKAVKFEKVGVDKMTLLIGSDEWPFAVPLVKSGSQWRFDSDTGAEELLNRRIGANEFDAMYVCQAYALAQFEYFNNGDWDGDQVSEYAQKIASSTGKKDGLYWETTADADEEESPLGPLFAYAAVEGYKAGKGTTKSAVPFHGYYYKVLYTQGASAPGGKFNYIINGNMIAGFALVAYPATWGNSGVMTFMVNQEGRVYEKNLGPATAAVAGAMTEYNPDVTWGLVTVD